MSPLPERRRPRKPLQSRIQAVPPPPEEESKVKKAVKKVSEKVKKAVEG